MFTFKITPDGGETVEVVAGPRDIVRWERAKPGRSFGRFGDAKSLSYADLYSLAHVAAQKRGAYNGSLAEFEDGVDVVLVEQEGDEDGEADPTPPAR